MRRVARHHHVPLTCDATAMSSLLSRVMVLCWHATSHRCCSSSAHTNVSTTTTSAVSGDHHDNGAGDVACSPMRYKSTHKGRGNVALPQKQGDGDGPASKGTTLSFSPFPSAAKTARDAAVGNIDVMGRENLAGSRSSCVDDVGAVPSRPLSPLQRRQLLFRHKAAFTLTPQALNRVKYLLQQCSESQRGQQVIPDGIRISVRRRGCSGYSYTVNYHFPESAKVPTNKTSDSCHKSSGNACETQKGDVVVFQDGVKVVVDCNALFYVIGTEMDYVMRNVEEKFTFRNPNQKYSCGCEESFMPFDEKGEE